MTHWTATQSARLGELMAAADADPTATWIGYWCTDAHGYPALHGTRDVRAAAGEIHTAQGPLRPNCGAGQLHATRAAHKWPGDRVWIVALHGPRRDADNKAWALTREIIGEILPAEAICDAGVALRLRAWRWGAYLGGADLGNWERGPDGHARRRTEVAP